MHAFMVSIFIYPRWLKTMVPTTSITQLVSAYCVFFTVVYVGNISSIMYVV